MNIRRVFWMHFFYPMFIIATFLHEIQQNLGECRNFVFFTVLISSLEGVQIVKSYNLLSISFNIYFWDK
jgi:hypothetical protein